MHCRGGLQHVRQGQSILGAKCGNHGAYTVIHRHSVDSGHVRQCRSVRIRDVRAFLLQWFDQQFRDSDGCDHPLEYTALDLVDYMLSKNAELRMILEQIRENILILKSAVQLFCS